jgi:3-isopropylmalate/(R)-2-methylmalate dehydratase small subunit
MDYGFEAIIAPSFGDIFRNNSSKQGLVIVQLNAVDVEELAQMVKNDPSRLLVVDVERLSVEVPESGWSRTFALDPMTRERLLEGWDDIGISLRRTDAITSYEETSMAPSMAGMFDAEGHVR